MSLPQLLSDLNIPETCIDKRTSASERSSSFVINRQPNETIWRIKVDGCWLDTTESQKVDYIFWCANCKERLVLVELKGNNFGKALNQIEATLVYLYNLKPELRQKAREGGICVYVVLSKGQAISRRLKEQARLQKLYKVIVRPKSQRLELNGLADLC